jgi:hypothetical protein
MLLKSFSIVPKNSFTTIKDNKSPSFLPKKRNKFRLKTAYFFLANLPQISQMRIKTAPSS